MINEKASIKDIAKSQSLKPDSIINHIDKLLSSKIELDIEYLKSEEKIFEKIKLSFEKCWFDSLWEVYRDLWKKMSYEDIKLVKLYLVHWV